LEQGSSKMRVLVVEDNAAVADSIRKMLETRKYAANVVSDGETGLDHLVSRAYDVAVVDVGLPGLDGFTLARNARAAGVQTPILMLTARDAVEDRVAGLNCGADDYLVKPFVEEELIARVSAILRRGERPLLGVLDVGALRVDLAARNVTYDGKPVPLGATEFRLLEFLARNAGIALSRAQIVERIWDYDFDGSSNIVDVYISQLRRKLGKLGAKGIIETVWGIGYRVKA
ncbi:MAG: response regulator transcription factor, partial [Candidatus Cybelea sp.]